MLLLQNGSKFSTADGSLSLAEVSEISGYDNLGHYAGLEFLWSPSELHFQTSVRLYSDRSIIVFKQEFLSSNSPLTGVSVGDDGFNTVSSSFPSLIPFKESGADRRGLFSFGGNMAGWVAESVAE